MNEQLIANNILIIVKEMNSLLLDGTIESTTVDIHSEFNNCLNDFLKLQNELFNVMQKQGWYQINNVETQKIATTISKLQKN